MSLSELGSGLWWCSNRQTRDSLTIERRLLLVLMKLFMALGREDVLYRKVALVTYQHIAIECDMYKLRGHPFPPVTKPYSVLRWHETSSRSAM